VSKDLGTLKEIVAHNNRLMDGVGHDYGEAEKRNLDVYTIKDASSGTVVYDFFSDVTQRSTVDPYKEYDKDELDKVIKKWKNR